MYNIIDGKKIAEEIKNKIKIEVDKLALNNQQVVLYDILIGNDEASIIYLNSKKILAEKLGIVFNKIVYDQNVSEEEVIKKIIELNNDKNVNGIIIEMPLPSHLNKNKILSTISQNKDVDALNYHIDFLNNDDNYLQFVPCTAKACLLCLEKYNINLTGKHVVILGRSNIVGKPLMYMLLDKNATVTICHSKTENIKQITNNADILIVAIGKKKFINSQYIKQNSIVIDVGIHYDIIDEKKVISGDVDFDDVKNKTLYITPVPGGVGSITSAILLYNCVVSKLGYEFNI